MCSILCWILSIWDALGCIFLHFWIDSCIVNKGEKFKHDLACCMHLEDFQVVSSYFWAWAVSQVASAWPVWYISLAGVVPRCWAILSTGLTSQSKAEAAALFAKWFACIRPGGVAFVQGGLFVVFELWIGGLHSLLEHSSVSDVSSRCPCLRGPRLVFFKWSCSLPFLGFRSLVGVSFICFFSFSFLSGYYMCVLSMHSSRGRLRTMCGSRTGGWSLPGVMSD
jgi:hypothetical protein